TLRAPFRSGRADSGHRRGRASQGGPTRRLTSACAGAQARPRARSRRDRDARSRTQSGRRKLRAQLSQEPPTTTRATAGITFSEEKPRDARTAEGLLAQTLGREVERFHFLGCDPRPVGGVLAQLE